MTFDSRSPSTGRPRLTAQVIVGLMVISLGVIFTLDNLGVIDARDYITYWPVVLVALGATKIWQAIHDGHGWFGGLLFFGIGSFMLIERVAYIEIDARDVFPFGLLCLGGYMVWRGFGGTSRPSSTASDGQNHFSSLSVMGGCSRRSNSQAFEGADLTAVMGGCEIDLRQASIAPNTEAIIDVFAFWGGIELQVPEDWTIITRAIPLMGGVEDKTRPPQPAGAKRLVIRGIVIMGGVSIKN
jgi:hypothetical protein